METTRAPRAGPRSAEHHCDAARVRADAAMNDLSTSIGSRRLRVTLRQLEVFVAVAKERSTRAAADTVARSQSAASSALAELEATIGHPLFDRMGRRLILNEHGLRLLPVACSLLEQAAELECMLDAHFDAPLSIAASMTIGEHILPDLLGRWHAKHPGSPVKMLVMNTAAVLDAVTNLEADIGFVEGLQTRNGIMAQTWLTDEMVVVARAGHPLETQEASVDQLKRASWALREVGSGTREAAERWLIEHLGSISIDFELGTPQAIATLVASSDTLACLPRHAVTRLAKAGDLTVLNTALPRAQRRLSIVTHAVKRMGPTSAAFVEHCMSVGRAH
jgi:DNA-binding transcriptional LysR family regulator